MLEHINICREMFPETFFQYQFEEQTLVGRRIKATRYMTKDLLDCMSHDAISDVEKINLLKQGLAEHYQNNSFLKCRSMGEIVKTSLKEMMIKNKPHVLKTKNIFE